MLTMSKKNTYTSRLKHWVQTLSPKERSQLRERFATEFKLSSNAAYYNTVNQATLPLDRALWFADQLGLSVEDITKYPNELGHTPYDDEAEPDA